jgi:hypothetical protein
MEHTVGHTSRHRRSLSRGRRNTHRRLRIGSRPRHSVDGIGLGQHQPDRRRRGSTRMPGRSRCGCLKPSAGGPLNRLLRRRWRWTRPPDRRSDPSSHTPCRTSPSAPHRAHRRTQHSLRDRRRFRRSPAPHDMSGSHCDLGACITKVAEERSEVIAAPSCVPENSAWLGPQRSIPIMHKSDRPWCGCRYRL